MSAVAVQAAPAMTSRLLPREEWPRLIGTNAETIWPALPADANVLAIEQDGAIVGCVILAQVYHAECLWIAPEHRGKSAVARRLWALLVDTAASLGVRTVAAAAVSDQMKTILAHVGAIRVPAETYVMTFKTFQESN